MSVILHMKMHIRELPSLSAAAAAAVAVIRVQKVWERVWSCHCPTSIVATVTAFARDA